MLVAACNNAVLVTACSDAVLATACIVMLCWSQPVVMLVGHSLECYYCCCHSLKFLMYIRDSLTTRTDIAVDMGYRLRSEYSVVHRLRF